MKSYSKAAGRFGVSYSDGAGWGHEVSISADEGASGAEDSVDLLFSIEDAHDLRYLLDRMIVASKDEGS